MRTTQTGLKMITFSELLHNTSVSYVDTKFLGRTLYFHLRDTRTKIGEINSNRLLISIH